MKNWKDRIWLLVLVIVGSSIMTFCKSGGGGGNSTTNLAFANGFKPSDISGVMICTHSGNQYRFDGDFYRDTGTVTAITPHTGTNVLVGVAAFTDNLSFSIGISGGTLQLELTNDDGSNAYTLKISATFITQLGGASS